MNSNHEVSYKLKIYQKAITSIYIVKMKNLNDIEQINKNRKTIPLNTKNKIILKRKTNIEKRKTKNN